MKIMLDVPFYKDVVTRASESLKPTYLCYSLCDKFSYWLVTPYLLSSLDDVRQFSKNFPDLFYMVCSLPPHVNPNEVKYRLAEHYHYQIFGDTYYKKPFKRNLFDLKLID